MEVVSEVGLNMSEGAFVSLSILFALAVAGLADLVHRRDMYRFNVSWEWRARESWMRSFTDSEEFIRQSKALFYQRKGLKVPKDRNTVSAGTKV